MATVVETVSQFNLRRMFDADFKNGVEVEWQDGGGGQFTCYGTIVCEDKGELGQNPFGHYSIRVDPDDNENFYRACHTAREMHNQMVCRSIDLHKLRLRTPA